MSDGVQHWPKVGERSERNVRVPAHLGHLAVREYGIGHLAGLKVRPAVSREEDVVALLLDRKSVV